MVPGPVNLGVILRKRLVIRGSTLRSRTLEYKDVLVSEVKTSCVRYSTIFPPNCWKASCIGE